VSGLWDATIILLIKTYAVDDEACTLGSVDEGPATEGIVEIL
jgi:hypothetical protein